MARKLLTPAQMRGGLRAPSRAHQTIALLSPEEAKQKEGRRRLGLAERALNVNHDPLTAIHHANRGLDALHGQDDPLVGELRRILDLAGGMVNVARRRAAV